MSVTQGIADARRFWVQRLFSPSPLSPCQYRLSAKPHYRSCTTRFTSSYSSHSPISHGSTITPRVHLRI